MAIKIWTKIKTKNKNRKGRGIAAGGGKTAGRGTKGQKSRAGDKKVHPGFEGGQTPLKLRLPKKKGFKPRNKKNLYELSLTILDKYFKDKEKITPEKIIKIKNLNIRQPHPKFKVLASGKTSKKFSFTEDFLFSKKAQKIKIDSEKNQEIKK